MGILEIVLIGGLVVMAGLVGILFANYKRRDHQEYRDRAEAVEKKSLVVRNETVVAKDRDEFLGGFGLTDETRKEKK